MFSGITETFQATFLNQSANVSVLINNCDFNEDFEVRLVDRNIGEGSSNICCRIVKADGFSTDLVTRVKLEIAGDNLRMTTNMRYRNFLDPAEMVLLAHLANKVIAGTEDMVGEYIHSGGTVVHVFGAEVDRCILNVPPSDIQPFFVDLMRRIILSGVVFLGFISMTEPSGGDSYGPRYDYSLDEEDLLSIADLMQG